MGKLGVACSNAKPFAVRIVSRFRSAGPKGSGVVFHFGGNGLWQSQIFFADMENDSRSPRRPHRLGCILSRPGSVCRPLVK